MRGEFSKWTPERAKAESEDKVLYLLRHGIPRRWGYLLEVGLLSSRTLKKALDRMIEKGLVYREVGTGEYPPPVFYGLTRAGRARWKEG